MNEGFRLGDSVLDWHIRDVDGMTDRMQRVTEAGRPLDRGAYGLVGQVFAIAAAGAADTASASVRTLATAAGGLGDGLRATRAGYRQVEDQACRTFGGPR